MKKIYTCYTCGFPFALDESEVPDYCPSCGAPKDQYLEEPWTGSIATRRIHVDPPAGDINRDPMDYSYHIAKDFKDAKGHGRIRRWIMRYDDPEALRSFYTDVFGWDIINTDHSDEKEPFMYCATGPGTSNWEPRVPSFGYGYLTSKRECAVPSFVVEVKNISKVLKDIPTYGGKVIKEKIEVEGETYAEVEDSEGNIFYLWEISGVQKPSVNPGRPPKKFTAKDLHGRTRCYVMSYKERDRFIRFYVSLFNWDMIEAPEAASGVKPGDEHQMLIIANGPSQPDYEGAVAGHMTMFVHWAKEELVVPGSFTEIHMEQPLSETLKQITDHGGKIITDPAKSAFAKEPSDEGWLVTAVVEDPAGNYLYLWKCPSSRTWEEPETEYDKE
jgi:predicted enzyme related to lactoylglutathione lyase